MWEYFHEYWGQFPTPPGGDREVAQPASLGEHLNARGRDGWELVGMEAHWQWEERAHGFVFAVFPSQIVGYALTFKRPK